MGRSCAPSRDGTFFRVERRYDILAPTRQYVQFSQKDAKTVLKKLKKKFWGTSTIPHFVGSLGVSKHERNDKHTLSVAKYFANQINI